MDRLTEPAPGRPTDGAESSPPVPPPVAPPREPVQRWRLTFARDPVPAEQVGRAAMDAWQDGLAGSGLPLARLEPDGAGRVRFALGAPLAAGCGGAAELADIWLLDRLPAWAVREAIEPRMPAAHRYIGAENVWLGSPPLAGQVAAAAWTVTLDAAPDPAALASAIGVVLDATSLPRVRARASGDRPYDLRPLIVDVAAGPEVEGAVTIRMTTRLDPALGSGRPEEVVAAIGDVLGTPLTIAGIVRDELILAEPRREAPPARPISPGRRPRR